jgi:hypothetical protein
MNQSPKVQGFRANNLPKRPLPRSTAVSDLEENEGNVEKEFRAFP